MYIASVLCLAIVAILLFSVAKVYRSVPLFELKRRARAGNKVAKSLYKVASYQYSSQFVLLLLATVVSAVFFVLISRRSPLWVALIASLVLIWFAYIWVPRSSIDIFSQYLAQICAKPLAWLLQYVHGPFNSVHKRFTKPPHTGLYEMSDLVRLLAAQQKQNDNRIDKFQIDLLKRVIDFGDIKVFDLMTPKRKVQSISGKEILGPVVLSELHKSGHSHFPVYEGKASNIVGILNIFGLPNSKLTVTVYELMSPSLNYINEEQQASEVLQAIAKTAQDVFIVINSDQDYVGIITARDILKTLVGDFIVGGFDQYDNREMVANRFAAKKPEAENTETEALSDEATDNSSELS